MLRLRKRPDCFGGYFTEVIHVASEDWDDPGDIASVVFGIVAATLAEPLRRAFRVHLDDHGCGAGGIEQCAEAWRLWELLPDSDKIAIG